jgi:hypothetical protein
MTVTNSELTISTIAKEALMLLDNNLVLGGLVNRAYEAEFDKTLNGYKVGATVPVRKPAKYTVRSGAVASGQASTEKTTNIAVNIQEGVDLQFTSADMTLNISNFSERFLKSAMIALANSVDMKITALYKNVWNWVGTPGTVLTSFAGAAKAGQRLDEMSVPGGERIGALCPADNWGLLGGLTGSFVQDIARPAIERAKLPTVGNIDWYGVQNVQSQTVGTKAGTPLVNGASQSVTYDGTNTQNLITDGWTASSAILNQGDVFTLAGVFALNPVSKIVMPYLQQFVVNAGISADGTGNATLSISPAIITSGAFQTVSAAPADNAVITVLGTASTAYTQSMVFHKNAFALCMVPMERPEGAVKVARESYKGLSVRLIPYYDGTNDVGNWRLDILYGVKAIYPDLATRLSGT